MNIPAIHGGVDQSRFFIYAAADSVYFDLYGIPLINSVLRNTDFGIHLHLFDPTPAQIEFCQNRDRVSVSYEYLSHDQFDSAFALWHREDLPDPWRSRKTKMLGLKQFSRNDDLRLWLRKTYYACMRFVRLDELITTPVRFLEIDIDGVVRSKFQITFEDDGGCDFYLYEKEKRDKITGQIHKTGHLAGAILYTDKPQARQFITDMSTRLHHEISADNIYWFLDQNVLDELVPRYRRGLLPMNYIDWRMQPHSAIWTAKGKRKDLEVFKQEIAKYR
jgi:hypothetical protein